METKIEKFIRLAKSTNAVASDVAKKELAKLGLDENGNPIGGAEKPSDKEPKKEKEPKKKSDKKKPSGRPSDIKLDAETITFKGKTYTLDDCQALFSAWKNKRKSQKESSEKSESKPITEKVLDKAETTIKQILNDKSAKKKIESDPKAAKKQLGSIELNLRRFLTSVEEFLGKKIPESKIKKIFTFFDEIELMENGGSLSYGDVYEGNLDEFANGGGVGDISWWEVKLKMPNGEIAYEDVMADNEEDAEYYGLLTDSADEGGEVISVRFKGIEKTK
jgi:hypothetical protein